MMHPCNSNSIPELARELALQDRSRGLRMLALTSNDQFVLFPCHTPQAGERRAQKHGLKPVCTIGTGWGVGNGCQCDECMKAIVPCLEHRISKGL
jgi:hypothetical protein